MTLTAAATWPIPTEDDVAAAERVVRSGIWLNGPETEALAEEWAEFTGARYCLPVSSCTHAIHLALLAADVAPGEPVVVPAYTFAGTVHPIQWIRAQPLFVDVNPISGMMLPAPAIEHVQHGRARAMLAVHLHGDVWPWIEDAVAAVGRARVLEDTCQAHGALRSGRHAGTFGTVGTFSLNAVKNLPAGQGGLLVTDDEEVYTEARRFRGYGQTDEDGLFETVGYSYPITELAAALARVHLRSLEADAARAAWNAREIVQALSPMVSVAYFGGVAHKVPLVFPDADCAAYALPRLEAAGVPVTRWQTAPIACHPVYGHDPDEFPGATAFVSRSIMLGTERQPVIAQPEHVIHAWLDAALPIIEEAVT